MLQQENFKAWTVGRRMLGYVDNRIGLTDKQERVKNRPVP